MGLGGGKIIKIHPANNGWVAIIRDEVDGKEYLASFVPITSEKDVCPETADSLIQMNEVKP